MNRVLAMAAGLLMLAVLATVGPVAADQRFSSAAFTTTSASTLDASAAHVRDWLHVYAEDTDPGGLTGYAIRRLSSPPTPAASGEDDAVVVDLGGFPDANQTFDFSRTITIMTPAAFPEAGVTQVTVAVTLAPDPATGDQPLRQVRIGIIGNAGGAATVTMAAGEQRQVNVTVRTRKQFILGQTMYPRVVLTLSYTGGPTGYFAYEIPMAYTNVGL